MRILFLAFISTFAITIVGGTASRADEKANLDKELKKFQGIWKFESVEAGGKAVPIDAINGITVVFDGEKYTVKNGDAVMQDATMKLDLSKSPKAIDVTVAEGPNKGTVLLGIYELSDDTLKVCFDSEGKKRPTKFKTESDNQTLVVHKRVKK